LSPGYRQGERLDDIIIDDALKAFGKEFAVDGDVIKALKRLSEVEAIRFLTIHKCNGLEFEKVVVLGVEEELFWNDAAVMPEFVAISRARQHLVLTYRERRKRPKEPTNQWKVQRTPYQRLLDFANEN
jgi:superfamily I DNA/RNA helicase